MTEESGAIPERAPVAPAVRQTRMFGEFFESRSFSYPNAPDVSVYASPSVVEEVNHIAAGSVDADRISNLLENAGRSPNAEPFVVNFYPGLKFLTKIAKMIPPVYVTHKHSVYAPLEEEAQFDAVAIERRAVNYQLKTNPGFWKNIRLGSWGLVGFGVGLDTVPITSVELSDSRRLLMEYSLMGITFLGFGLGALKRKITTDRILAGKTQTNPRFMPFRDEEPAES